MIEGRHWLRTRPVAHRGLHDSSKLIIENSFQAFEAAIAADAPIEMDVHLLSDNNIVVYHDDNTKRLTGVDRSINSFTKSDLATLRLSDTNSGVPLFNDFLDFVGGRVPILIEIKSRGEVGRLEPILAKALESYSGEYAVQSFNPFVVDWFREYKPKFLRGQLSGTFKDEDMPFHRKFALRNLLLNMKTKPHFIAIEAERISSLSTRYWRSRGLTTLAWTIRSNEQLEQTSPYADNIIFEDFSPVKV